MIQEGERFGKLTTVRKIKDQKSGRTKWICICDCGETKEVCEYSLKYGKTKSCGCLHKEIVSKMGKSHKKYNQYNLKNKYGIGYIDNNASFLFDLEDYDLIYNYYWYIAKEYVVANNGNGQIRLQDLVMHCPIGYVVDHIYHDKLDNRKENLRICRQNQNSKNRSINRNNKSGYTGVQYVKKVGKYRAQIKYNYKSIHLGYYADINEAIKARKEAEIKYFGEYANDDKI